jgi:hypothetical protein
LILNEEEDEEVAFCCDLRSMIYYLFFFGFSELGAGRSKDGLGQDVPATMKRSLVSSHRGRGISGFSDLCPPTSVYFCKKGGLAVNFSS